MNSVKPSSGISRSSGRTDRTIKSAGFCGDNSTAAAADKNCLRETMRSVYSGPHPRSNSNTSRPTILELVSSWYYGYRVHKSFLKHFAVKTVEKGQGEDHMSHRTM